MYRLWYTMHTYSQVWEDTAFSTTSPLYGPLLMDWFCSRRTKHVGASSRLSRAVRAAASHLRRTVKDCECCKGYTSFVTKSPMNKPFFEVGALFVVPAFGPGSGGSSTLGLKTWKEFLRYFNSAFAGFFERPFRFAKSMTLNRTYGEIEFINATNSLIYLRTGHNL